MEKIISAMLHNRGAYEEIKDTLDTADFSDMGTLLINEIIEYYNADTQAQSVDIDIVLSRIKREHPSHYDLLEAALTSAEPVSIPNMLREYVEVRLRSLSLRLSQALTSGTDPSELMREHQFLSEKKEKALNKAETDRIDIGLKVNAIMDSMSQDKLIQLAPVQVNEAVGGGVPPGTHIVILARPEAGKTMFCINLAAHFVSSGRRALYVGNEDPATSIQQRMVSNVTGLTKAEIEADRQHAQEVVEDMIGDRLIYADLHPGTVGNIRGLVAEYRPDVVIVDQIRNLRTPKTFTKVEGLEYIAKEMRNIGKEYGCVMVSVTQAGDSADGKLELEMGDVDFSNTGIPATADLMLGIGVTAQMEHSNHRVISYPKNKITGLHAATHIRVDPQHSIILDN